MPDYPSFARFADYNAPAQPTDFVRMPDGSLVMTGRSQVQAPSVLDRLKAAASSVIPAGLMRRSEPAVPWWIAQPQAAQAGGPAPLPMPTNAPVAKGQSDWDAIAREAAHEQALAAQLGDFSTRVMNSPQLIEGKWFSK
jgi:hypothetical protein